MNSWSWNRCLSGLFSHPTSWKDKQNKPKISGSLFPLFPIGNFKTSMRYVISHAKKSEFVSLGEIDLQEVFTILERKINNWQDQYIFMQFLLSNLLIKAVYCKRIAVGNVTQCSVKLYTPNNRQIQSLVQTCPSWINWVFLQILLIETMKFLYNLNIATII